LANLLEVTGASSVYFRSMSTNFLSVTPHGKRQNSPKSVVHEQDTIGTEILTISFSPDIKLLCAKWLKPVNSSEYRQNVRMIARAIAFLRAELILTDVEAFPTISEADQHWTARFLREALAKCAIRRSARVIHSVGFQPEAMQRIVQETGKLPYEVKVFSDVEEATHWLLEGQGIDTESTFRIPLNFNMKMVRHGMMQPEKEALPAAAVQTAVTSPTPAPLPERLTITTEFLSITIDKHESSMILRWKKAPESRQYRYGMLKAYRALKEHRLEHMLLNNQRLGVLTLEDQAWLVATAIELIPKMSLKKLAVVNSADALQQMSSELIGCKLKDANLPHTTWYFLTEEEAKEWMLGDVN
jgi:hypothetical protein